MKNLHKSARDHREMCYNAYRLMREYYTYEEICEMPLGVLFDEIDFFSEKAKEIAQQQANDKIERQLGKQPPARKR